MKNFVVLGLGRFGSSVAQTLYSLGYEVLAIDRDEERVQMVLDHVTHGVTADIVDESVLRTLGVQNMHTAVIAIGDDMQSSILTSLMLRDMGVAHIVAKAQNELHAKVLKKVGVDEVVFPEHDMAVRLANHLAAANILDYIEISPGYSIMEITIPTSWIGKTATQLDVRKKHGVSIIGVKRGDHNGLNITPDPNERFEEGDLLIVVGGNNFIKELSNMK